MRINIAIDGPSGAGKSTVAKGIAAKMGIIHVDTGAMYRTVGLYMYENGIELSDENGIVSSLENVDIKLEYENGAQHIYLNGRCVDSDIRTDIVSTYASGVSTIQAVRDFLLDTQRNIAKNEDVVMDGRDIGTVVLPDAGLKIFMTANDESRARRRYKELLENGESVTFEEVFENMVKRDSKDKNRKIAPAVPADDAVMFDNTEYGLEESIDYVIDLAKKRFAI